MVMKQLYIPLKKAVCKSLYVYLFCASLYLNFSPLLSLQPVRQIKLRYNNFIRQEFESRFSQFSSRILTTKHSRFPCINQTFKRWTLQNSAVPRIILISFIYLHSMYYCFVNTALIALKYIPVSVFYHHWLKVSSSK